MTEQFHHQLVFGSLHCFETKMNKVEMKDLISDVLIFPASFHAQMSFHLDAENVQTLLLWI